MADKLEIRFVILGDGDKQQDERTIHITPGASLYDAALLAEVPIVTTCGGKGTCGKCYVKPHGTFNQPTYGERHFISSYEFRAGYRLACQTIPDSDATVEVNPGSRSVVILTRGTLSDFSVRPNARRVHVQVQYPIYARSEMDAVLQELKKRGHSDCTYALPALQVLSAQLREGRGCVTITLLDHTIVAIEAGEAPVRGATRRELAAPPHRSPYDLYGMAFDIGTTTVVGYLMDLERGRRAAVVSMPNPQAAYGADVISRLTSAIRAQGDLDRLRSSIRGGLNSLIVQAARQAGIDPNQILEVTVVGNTAMHHLFLGVNPTGLLFAPYTPVGIRSLEISAHEAGLSIAKAGRVIVLPNIGGFVGADTVGVILATGIDRATTPKLAIDIGTNGEMVLGARGRLLSCSTAAGPAFEGAHIYQGMVAAEGAIDQVQVVDRVLHVHTIGGVTPKGICGSGLVDLAAVLLDEKLLQPDGRLVRPDCLPESSLPELARRISAGERGLEVRLSEAGDPPVVLIQKDIRELQLAKGAIRSGIEILLKVLGVAPEEVDEVYLAGAFGNYIRPESACRIGLLPDFPKARITPVGNAAGTGAQMALLSTVSRRRAARVPSQVEYVDLATRPDFQMEFAAAMRFPQK